MVEDYEDGNIKCDVIL